MQPRLIDHLGPLPIMLGLGRALGETMAVTFVIGNAGQRVAACAGHDDLCS